MGHGPDVQPGWTLPADLAAARRPLRHGAIAPRHLPRSAGQEQDIAASLLPRAAKRNGGGGPRRGAAWWRGRGGALGHPHFPYGVAAEGFSRPTVESETPMITNCTARAQRIRPSTRMTTIVPTRPSSRVIRPANQKLARIETATAKITPMPAASPAKPSRPASPA